MEVNFTYHVEEDRTDTQVITIPDDTPLNRVEAVGLTRLRNGFSLDSREFAKNYDGANHHAWFVIQANDDVDMGTHGTPLVEDNIPDLLAEVWRLDP